MQYDAQIRVLDNNRAEGYEDEDEEGDEEGDNEEDETDAQIRWMDVTVEGGNEGRNEGGDEIGDEGGDEEENEGGDEEENEEVHGEGEEHRGFKVVIPELILRVVRNRFNTEEVRAQFIMLTEQFSDVLGDPTRDDDITREHGEQDPGNYDEDPPYEYFGTRMNTCHFSRSFSYSRGDVSLFGKKSLRKLASAHL